MKIEEYNDSIIIHLDSFAHFLRKREKFATDPPLTDREKVMIKMAQELSRLRGEVEKIQKLRINISDHAEKAEITARDFKLGSYQEGYWEGYAKALYRASDSMFDGLEQLQQREDDGG